jgi:glycosyltransferase involved in cell wall biosynthesis
MVLEGETGLLVEPRDSTELGESIRRLLDDPELRVRLGLAGHERAREFWSTTKIAERTASLYWEYCRSMETLSGF